MRHKTYKKIVLVVLDGFGIASESHGNAIAQAKIPTFNFITANFPSYTIQASGPLVGLPWGEMGNSEVGHLNIGAGRIVGQDLPRITTSIQNGDFFKNKAFLGAVAHVKNNGSRLHIMGMVSPGGVHSFDEHLYAMLGFLEQQHVAEAYIHMFTDGRDTDQKIAKETLVKLRTKISQTGVGTIATIAGRFYAMDRGGHWAQTAMEYQALVDGKGELFHSPEECIESNYQNGIFDEMIQPSVILNDQNEPVGKISDNDAVIFINFRQDRALQLTKMFVKPSDVPEEFRRSPLQNLFFVTMCEYEQDLPVHVAFLPMDLKNNLAEIISNKNMTQFHIAESEKYAHVTAFFNGGRTNKFPNEERVIVTSPEDNAHNYVDKPEMSAPELTNILVEKITKTETNFLLANYANGDMVGHTGSLPASIKAVEYLDVCMKRVLDACLLVDAALIITADHGNVEQMINMKTGEIDKDHTTSPVPFLLAANEFKFKQSLSSHTYIGLSAQVPIGAISDIAPTILDLFGMEKPMEMTGVSLLDEMAKLVNNHLI